MDNHTSFNKTLKDLCLRLMNFVLTNSYVECDELERGIYCQHVGAVIGTFFGNLCSNLYDTAGDCNSGRSQILTMHQVV